MRTSARTNLVPANGNDLPSAVATVGEAKRNENTVAKQPYIAGRGRSSKNQNALGRADQVAEDDRPFADIRKNVHDALRMLSLHRWAFVIPATIVACAAFVLSLYYPRTYQARTSFERRDDPVMMSLPLTASAASFKFFRNTMVRDLTAVECMRQVVEKLDLIDPALRDAAGALTDAGKRNRDSIARSLAGTLNVSTETPSEHMDIITITYTGPDPTIGKRLVDEVKRTFIVQTMDWIHNELVRQRDYFKQRADEALEEVKLSRRDETRLRMENPLVDPANPGEITLKLAQFEMERRELKMRQRQYKAEVAAVEQMLAATVLAPPSNGPAISANQSDSLETTAVANVSVEAMRLASQIREVDGDVQKLRATRGMTDHHPMVAELLEQRRWLDSELERQREQDRLAPPPVHAITMLQAGTNLDVSEATISARAERTRMLAQLAANNSKLQDVEISLETNENGLTSLHKAKNDVYQKQDDFAEVVGRVSQSREKLQKVEETLAALAPAITAIEQGRLLHFSQGQPARGSSRPISPKASTVLLLALLAGLGTGVLFVVLAEVFDHIFRSSSQVARGLGLPMLESIDEIVTTSDRRFFFVRRVLLSPMMIIGFVVLTGLAGSMAYLSLEQPWTYLKLRRIPEAALNLFAG